MELREGCHIHFMAIGGVSMSALALYMQSWGYRVSGCDRVESPTLAMLREKGIPCYVGHAAIHLETVDVLAYNAAIDSENPEYIAATEKGIPMLYRGDLLGMVMQRYEKMVCVCGTHGKTTASGALSHLLESVNLRPTLHLGGILPLISASCKVGERQLFVAEACEYKDSFLGMFPTHSIMLNIRPDHLDYFANLDTIQASFARFAGRHPANGYILGFGEDTRVREVLAGAPCRTETFGRTPECDWQAANMTENKGFFAFDVLYKGRFVTQLRPGIPGEHNVLNSLSAFAMAMELGVAPEQAAAALISFGGMKRRMEHVGDIGQVPVYHDYAHHPDEVRATLKMAASMTEGRLYCVFQPHTYSRTKLLFEDWLQVFGDADVLYITDIYAAREVDPGDISGRLLADALVSKGVPATYTDSFAVCAGKIRSCVQPGDMVITLGAGSIDGMSALLTD